MVIAKCSVSFFVSKRGHVGARQKKSELLGFLTFSDIFDIDATIFNKNVFTHNVFIETRTQRKDSTTMQLCI